jgi:carboxyl-terminal processing protease
MVNSFCFGIRNFSRCNQDYKRGIIIGSKQTYGKGTVQNVIDLNQFVRNNEVGDLGALKLLRKNSTGLMVALLN